MIKIKIIGTILLIYLVSIDCQQNDLRGLSYSNTDMRVYPTQTTTTTTTTPKSSFFGGIRNYFRKTPTTLPPEPSTVPTTKATPVPVTPKPNQNVRDFVAPTTTTTKPKENFPGLPSVPVTPKPNQNVRDFVAPTTTTTKPKENFPGLPAVPVNPKPNQNVRDYVAPVTSSTTAKPKENFPGLPPVSVNPKPNQNVRDYVAPVPTTKKTTPKDDFPALPTQRGGTPSQPPTPTIPSVWGSTKFTNGVTTPTTQNIPRPTTVPKAPIPQVQSGGAKNEDNELTELTELLLTKDTNNAYKYVKVNFQGKTQSFANSDEASEKLLTVDELSTFSIPTIEKLRVMYNNYELDTAINEYVTPIEKKEENDFIDTVLTTSVMRQTMLYLQQKGKVTLDPKTHRELLKTIWFSLYSRGGGKIGSSAFEHIFLSEMKNGALSGLHNWLYFYDEESKGFIDYKGYMKKIEFGNKGAIVKLRFTKDNIQKPVNSMFIGTSPELELSLYTLCFQMRPDQECPVSLGGNKFTIRTHTFRYRGKNLIGSAFPEI